MTRAKGNAEGIQAPMETLVMRGYYMPPSDFVPNIMRLILPDDDEIRLTACLAELELHPQPRIDRPEFDFSNPTRYTILTPEGVRVQSQFLMWWGNHAAFYVKDDDVTVMVWIRDIPRLVGRSVR